MENVVSAVLFVTDPHEKTVYFVSKSLTGAEKRYKNIEKIALALFHASRRLKPYFQVRQIVVYSEYPLKRILECADDSIRLAIWSNFLGSYEIKYETRTVEKRHALVALLAYFPVDDKQTVTEEEEELFKPIEPATDHTGGESVIEVDTPEPLWTVFTDGASNVGGDGCVILTPEGSRIEKATRLGFQASNNDAEYEAAIIGLKAVKQLYAKNVKLVTDSMLVVSQFLGTYRSKEERMALYLDHMRELPNDFDQFSIGKRTWLENRHADALAYLSSAVENDTTCFVVVDFQELPSISDIHFVLALEHASGGERTTTSTQGDTENIDRNMDIDSPVIDGSGNPAENASDWRQPYIRYLTTSELPEDEKLASKVKKNACRYSMIEGELYSKPVGLDPFLRCISAEEGQQILAEAHEGICGNHSGGRSLAHMILSQGYFWSYMQKYAKECAHKCVPCQEHAPVPKRPANELHPVFSPWSFSMWGLDIVVPLPKAPGGVKFVLAATDYFTKWVKAVALVHVTRHDVKRFIWENIVCIFGISDAIVSDNGKQSDSGVIKDFCKNLNIRHNFSSPYYAQSNGQAEATNCVIMDNLKKRLEKAKGKWT
ncbi:uncharacterized protein LOC113280473 [Papaver somniferum]|uniref:uncharacterized protein LOC113280473 n=1 Tax=Papaver somniferum TaxID=3469 RepID=UPI000E6FE188|nr:uncharacterized protein LOC113280473 [Papaver somniferum]